MSYCTSSQLFLQWSIGALSYNGMTLLWHINERIESEQSLFKTTARAVVLTFAMTSFFLAGSNHTAQNKPAPGGIHPTAVGESIRHLTGKCLCVALKERAASFFEPFQFGVACPNSAEKAIHGLRTCMDQHWFNDDSRVLKIDMKNGFSLVSPPSSPF